MSRMRGRLWVPVSLWACGIALMGCGGSPPAGRGAESPQASSAAPSEDDAALPQGEEVPRETSPSSSEPNRAPEGASPGDDAPPPQAAKSQVEPEFRAGMTVNEAINAVPQGTERVNVDQEALEAPLVREELYAPCKLSPSQHFKLRVAVWDGRAVGVDIETQPKNEKLASCLREQLEGVRWQSKAKSLNTVEYAY